MKFLRSLSLVIGSPMLLIGLGMVIVYSAISYNTHSDQLMPILVGAGLALVGWACLMYAHRSVGKSIIDTIVSLLG